MVWIFANATRRAYRCVDGTVALIWSGTFGTDETFECLEHGVRECRHVREARSALPPQAGTPSRPHPSMFERDRRAPH